MSFKNKNPTARNRALWTAEDLATRGELEILEQPHLHALADNPKIRDMLKTKELQKLIRNVDGSRCRLEALAAAQHNIPEFKKFCDEVLSAIYDCEDERHRFKY